MKKEAAEFEILGKFKVKSGEIRVTDPCYNKDTWCAGKLAVKNGTWTGAVRRSDEESWGIRIKELLAWHQTSDAEEAQTATKDSHIDVGVDSGQAGFFDEKYYPQEGTGDYGDLDTFYGQVCELTIGPGRAGVLPFGVVSSSGYGDGSYNCYLAHNDQKEIVALRIDFIPDEERDPDDYEDPDEDLDGDA